MSDHRIPMPTPGRFLTLYDIEIARILYRVLLEHARDTAEPIYFFELIESARSLVPDREHPIHKQVCVGIGRRLEALRMFTDAHGHPDLSCLAMNSTGDSPLPDFTERLAALREYDWASVDDELETQCHAWEKRLRRRPTRRYDEAKNLMWAHFRTNRARYHADIEYRFRAEMIAELEAGGDVEEVFANFNRTLREPEPA